MLNHLANYLLQYGQVSIPHVGILQLVRRPPVLNVADKIIEPPSYAVEISSGENITEHQVNFLSGSSGMEREAVLKELQLLGNEVSHKMSREGFDWKGIGTIKGSTQSLAFTIGSLQPLAADKVIRQDAMHTVLVGDKQVRSAQSVEQSPTPAAIRKRPSISMLVGWSLLVLSLLAIAVLLYSGNFAASAAGSRLSPKSWIKLNEDSPQR